MNNTTTWSESDRPRLYFVRHHIQHLLRKRTEQTYFCKQALLLNGCFPTGLQMKRLEAWNILFIILYTQTLAKCRKNTKWQNHQANTKQTVVFAGQLRIVLLKIGFENIGFRWEKKPKTHGCVPFSPDSTRRGLDLPGKQNKEIMLSISAASCSRARPCSRRQPCGEEYVECSQVPMRLKQQRCHRRGLWNHCFYCLFVHGQVAWNLKTDKTNQQIHKQADGTI